MNSLKPENVLRLPLQANLADNGIANEIADEIRRVFGSWRHEDIKNWVYVTSNGVEGHGESRFPLLPH